MFRFTKNLLVAAMTFVEFGALISSKPLKSISMNNQEYKVRQTMVNITSNELLFYSYSVFVNKCSGSWNDINNPFT